MSYEEQLADLLLKWEELHEQGQDASAEDLCKDSPEHVEELNRRIHALKVLGWVKKPVEDADAELATDGSTGPRTLAGRYRLDLRIGEGGFGEVWRGFDLELQRTVAVKLPRPSRLPSPEQAEAFLAEARKVARLRHPCIVPIHDVGREAGRYFFVTDFIEGNNLEDHYRQDRFSYEQIARIVAEIAVALDYAHQQGFVHRDIKPANILLDTEDRPFLTDFGIAVEQTEQNADRSGTLAYMAPEQVDTTSQPLDPRTDVYSLGVVLYELLTQRLPFDAPGPVALRQRIVSTEPPSPRSINPTIPKELERICLKCLAKNPGSRYTTARHLAVVLNAFLSPKNGKAVVLTIILGLVLVGLVIGLAIFFMKQQRPRNDDEQRLAYAAEEVWPAGQIACFRGHEGRVVCAVFSPNSKRIASGGAGSTVRLWDVENPSEEATILQHSSMPTSLAFSVDGKTLAVGSEGGTVRLWDISGPKPSQKMVLPGHKGTVSSLAFSPDGKFLLSGSKDGTVKIRLFTPKGVGEAQMPVVGPVFSIVFSSKGDKFIVGVGKVPPKPNRLYFCDLMADKGGGFTVRPTGQGPMPDYDVRSVASTPDGTIHLATDDKKVSVWSVDANGKDFKGIGVFWQHTGAVFQVALSSDGRHALSCAADQTVRWWDTKSLEELRCFRGHEQAVNCVALSNDRRMAVSGSDDGTVRVWSLKE